MPLFSSSCLRLGRFFWSLLAAALNGIHGNDRENEPGPSFTNVSTRQAPRRTRAKESHVPVSRHSVLCHLKGLRRGSQLLLLALDSGLLFIGVAPVETLPCAPTGWAGSSLEHFSAAMPTMLSRLGMAATSRGRLGRPTLCKATFTRTPSWVEWGARWAAGAAPSNGAERINPDRKCRLCHLSRLPTSRLDSGKGVQHGSV